MEKSPMPMEGKTNILKTVILPTAIYRFDTRFIKIPTQLITELERTNFSYIETQNHRATKTTLHYKKTVGGITIPNLKLYYRATVLKTA